MNVSTSTPQPGPLLLGDGTLTTGEVCAVAEQGREVDLTPDAWTQLVEEKTALDHAVDENAAVSRRLPCALASVRPHRRRTTTAPPAPTLTNSPSS